MTPRTPTPPRRRAAVLLAPLAALALATAAPAQSYDDPSALPEGPGREDTFYLCSACHSFNLVSRQGMSRALWEDTLTLMVERHGMFELTEEERRLVLDYLEAAYPPRAPEQRGFVNPFLNR